MNEARLALRPGWQKDVAQHSSSSSASPPRGLGSPVLLPSLAYLERRRFPCDHAMTIGRLSDQVLVWIVRSRELFSVYSISIPERENHSLFDI